MSMCTHARIIAERKGARKDPLDWQQQQLAASDN